HSLKQILADHGILRSFYPYIENQPVQLIHDGLEVKLNMFDLSQKSSEEKEKEKQEILFSDARLPFNLDEFPLIRTTLIKLSESQHIFLMTMHHIIFDKWSMDLFLKMFSKEYLAFVTNNSIEKDVNNLQFSDYAFWQKSRVLDEVQVAYWKMKLGGEIPTLDLPTDYPQPSRPTF